MTAISGYLLACADCELYLSFAGERLQLKDKIQNLARKTISIHNYSIFAQGDVKENFTYFVVINLM